MSFGSFLGLMVTDPAAAGFSFSGDRAVQGNATAPQAARGLDDGSHMGMGYGLTPPAAEQPAYGTGLQEAEGWHGHSGHADAGLGYTQRVAQALGVDPYHFGFADGLGGGDWSDVHMLPVGGSVRAPAESAPFEISTNPRTAAAFDLLSNMDPNLDFTGGPSNRSATAI